MKFSYILLLLPVLSRCANTGWNEQGTPDDVSPGNLGENNVCDAYQGNVKSLCKRYCYAQDCYLIDTGTIVPSTICNKVYSDFVAATGVEPPCTKPCPCFDADTLAGKTLYCHSYAPNSFYVTDSLDTTDLIAFAFAEDSTRNCALTTNILSGNIGRLLAPLTQAQADNCLALLYGTDCIPYEDPDTVAHD